MNKVKMTWIADKIPTNENLHQLYTTVRDPIKKHLNLNEEFKIWNDGRKIHIIMDDNKITQISTYQFVTNNGTSVINIKPLDKIDFIPPVYKKGDIVNLSGILSYSHKYYKEDNKFIEVCPINMEGKFKSGLKKGFIDYLEDKTGLLFSSMTEDTTRLRFERLFTDEKNIYEKKSLNRKVYYRNIVLIQGILEIVDPNKLSQLSYQMIGKKRSYGFGNFMVE